MRLTSLSIVIALAVTAPAMAQKNTHGNADRNQPTQSAPSTTSQSLFGAATERSIRSYFQTHQTAPQGLPPGIAKKLARGKPLPPGIAKRALPAGLQGQLPSFPGREIVIVDRDVLLVDLATQVVVDILKRVL